MSAAAQEPGLPAAPKVTELGMASIAFVAAGVINLAAYLPRRAPLGPAVALAAIALLVLVVNLAILTRRRDFAWWRFNQVAGWMLLVYVVVAGMLEFTFIYDHTRGAVLGLMTVLLTTFTLNVPLIAGFTVARFESAER